ncbi:spore photoproduct lyase [Clostridium perfringens]|nr:spore photoproduct lyase [Clostridium perfringens]
MFKPKRILFEKNSLNYEMGRNIYNYFKEYKDIEIIELKNNRIKQNIPGDDIKEFYKEGKSTIVVGVKRVGKFQSCKPSAHWQLPLLSGCVGNCQYCYLNTNLGDKPYVKINVNLEDILNQAQKYIDERKPNITIFEGSATSDPIPVEPYTNSLKRAIEFFANNDFARFRFVTKYTYVDSLLGLDHNGKTEVRFTINTDFVINNYERRTASLCERINASVKIAKANYPLGFIIAPVFIYEGWKEDYENLLKDLKEKLPRDLKHKLTFEVISHRYTTRAKNIIMDIFPDNKLPMDDEKRTFKYGQFGYGKYVYKKEYIHEIKEFFMNIIDKYFPMSEIKYII